MNRGNVETFEFLKQERFNVLDNSMCFYTSVGSNVLGPVLTRLIGNRKKIPNAKKI